MASLSKITFLTILQEIENTFSHREKVPLRADEGVWKILISGLLPPILFRDRNDHPIQ